MEVNSNIPEQTSETAPVYVNPNQMSNINNIRLRHAKLTTPTEEPAHFILSTGDFPSNDFPVMSKNKHKKLEISFLIFTVLSYLLYTLRIYIPENIEITSSKYKDFWSSIKPSPITRVYTLDFRPSLSIENFLLRSAEIFQSCWLIYILSYIPRRTSSGYLYRNPNIFNSFFSLLLISALSLQGISQTVMPPEISSVCLLFSFILLIISCRLIAMKLIIYEEKIKSIELLILRYFVLNSLFLYTISIGYRTICMSIECFAFHLDPNVILIKSVTTIGLLIVFIFLLIYCVLDRFVYENEFWSIWTPYLFIAIAFMCPPLRRVLSNELFLMTDDLNFYLLWALFSATILMICIRIGRQILIKYREKNRKSYVDSYTEQISLEAKN